MLLVHSWLDGLHLYPNMVRDCELDKCNAGDGLGFGLDLLLFVVNGLGSGLDLLLLFVDIISIFLQSISGGMPLTLATLDDFMACLGTC